MSRICAGGRAGVCAKVSSIKSDDLPVLIKKCFKLSFFIVRSSRHNVNKTSVCFAVYYSTVLPLFLVYSPLTAGSLTLTSLSGLFFFSGFYMVKTLPLLWTIILCILHRQQSLTLTLTSLTNSA